MPELALRKKQKQPKFFNLVGDEKGQGTECPLQGSKGRSPLPEFEAEPQGFSLRSRPVTK